MLTTIAINAIGARNPPRISNSIGPWCRIISTTKSSPAKNSKASEIPRWNRAISDSSRNRDYALSRGPLRIPYKDV
jgi:hypothetical protein